MPANQRLFLKRRWFFSFKKIEQFILNAIRINEIYRNWSNITGLGRAHFCEKKNLDHYVLFDNISSTLYPLFILSFYLEIVWYK